MVLASTSGGVTVTAFMFSPYSHDVAAAPYELQDAGLFDLPVTLAHLPGT